jgi:hypothetical protein
MRGIATGNYWGALLGLIPVAVAALGHLMHASEKAVKRANELTESYKQTQQTLQSNASTAKSLIAEYSELSAGIDRNGKNVSLTAEQYERLKVVSNELADLYPELSRHHTAEGMAILDLTGNIEQMTSTLERLIEAQQKAADMEFLKEDANEVINGRTQEVKDLNKQIDLLNKVSTGGSFRGDQSDFHIVSNARNTLKELDVEIKEVFDRATGKFKFELDENSRRKVIGELDKLKGQIDNTFRSFNPVIEAILRVDGNYSFFADDIQSLISQVAMNADWSKLLTTINKDTVEEWIQTNLINRIANLSPENEAALENVLAELFDMDMSGSAQVVHDRINELLTWISQFIDDVEPIDLAKMLGFDIDTLPQIQEYLKELKIDKKHIIDLSTKVDLDELKQLKDFLDDIEDIAKRSEIAEAFAINIDRRTFSNISRLRTAVHNNKTSIAAANAEIRAMGVALGLTGNELESFTKKFGNLRTEVKPVATAIRETADAFGELQSAMSKAEKNQKFTFKELMDLVDGKIIKLTDIDFDNMTVPVEAFKRSLGEMQDEWDIATSNMRETANQDFEDIVKGQIDTLMAAHRELSFKPIKSSDDYTQLHELGEEHRKLQQALEEGDIELAILIIGDEVVIKALEDIKERQDAINNVEDVNIFLTDTNTIDELLAKYKEATTEIERSALSDKILSDLKDLKPEVDAGAEAWENYDAMVNRVNQTLAGTDLATHVSNLSTLKSAYEQWAEDKKITTESLEKIRDALGLTQESVDSLFNAFDSGSTKKINAEISNLIDSYIDTRMAMGDLTEAQVKQFGQMLESIGVKNGAAVASHRYAMSIAAVTAETFVMAEAAALEAEAVYRAADAKATAAEQAVRLGNGCADTAKELRTTATEAQSAAVKARVLADGLRESGIAAAGAIGGIAAFQSAINSISVSHAITQINALIVGFSRVAEIMGRGGTGNTTADFYMTQGVNNQLRKVEPVTDPGGGGRSNFVGAPKSGGGGGGGSKEVEEYRAQINKLHTNLKSNSQRLKRIVLETK